MFSSFPSESSYVSGGEYLWHRGLALLCIIISSSSWFEGEEGEACFAWLSEIVHAAALGVASTQADPKLVLPDLTIVIASLSESIAFRNSDFPPSWSIRYKICWCLEICFGTILSRCLTEIYLSNFDISSTALWKASTTGSADCPSARMSLTSGYTNCSLSKFAITDATNVVLIAFSGRQRAGVYKGYQIIIAWNSYTYCYFLPLASCRY